METDRTCTLLAYLQTYQDALNQANADAVVALFHAFFVA